MVALRVFSLLAVLSLALGCGRNDSTTPSIDPDRLLTAIRAETGDTNTTLIFDRGNIQIRTAGQTITVDQTETRRRPSSLPSDIALPDDAHYDLWTEAPRGATLSLRTNLQPEALADYFLREWPAQSWQNVSDVQADTLRCLAFRKANRQVAITIESEPENDPSTRALLYLETLPEPPAS